MLSLWKLAQPASNAATATARTGMAGREIRERPDRAVAAIVVAFDAD
jgi:hypothetical protein